MNDMYYKNIKKLNVIPFSWSCLLSNKTTPNFISALCYISLGYVSVKPKNVAQSQFRRVALTVPEVVDTEN